MKTKKKAKPPRGSVKIRKIWAIRPGTRVKPSKKIYKREKSQEQILPAEDLNDI